MPPPPPANPNPPTHPHPRISPHTPHRPPSPHPPHPPPAQPPTLSSTATSFFLKHSLHAAAQLKTELLRVAGRNACRRALLALRPLLKTMFQEGKGSIIKRKPLATLPTKPLAEPLAKPLTRQAARQAARAKPSAKPLAKPPAETDLAVQGGGSWRGKCLPFGRHSMSRDDFLKWDSGIMGIVSYLSLSFRVAERLPPWTSARSQPSEAAFI